MSSSVFFRFKSQKEPSRVTFDGTGISVFELKREIILASRLGDGTDFELVLSSVDGNEEYDDDTTIIPRSTTVIAKRLPAARPGKGGAARYVSGKAPIHAKNSHRSEAGAKAGPGTSTQSSTATPNLEGQTEEERMAAILQMGSEQWSQQKQQMANATKVYRAGGKDKPANVPDRPLPPGYVCYRCGEKGHWIQECPTNDDPNFQNQKRLKRTTGIPKSFLKTVEKPANLADGNSEAPAGVMINAEGDWVIAEPDKASWEQFQAKANKSAAAQQKVDSGLKEIQEKGLACPIDKRLFVDPTKTPCCQTTYCNECITNALLDDGLQCPKCETEGVLIDDLKPDTDMVARIREYEEEKAKEAKVESATEAKEEEAGKDVTSPTQSGSPAAEHALKEDDSKDGKDIKDGKDGKDGKDDEDDKDIKDVKDYKDQSEAPSEGSKKRKASTELDNDRKSPSIKNDAKDESASTKNAPKFPPELDFMNQLSSSGGGPMPAMNAMAGMGMGMNMNMMQMNPMMMQQMMSNPMFAQMMMMQGNNMGNMGNMGNMANMSWEMPGGMNPQQQRGPQNNQPVHQPPGMQGVPTGPRSQQNPQRTNFNNVGRQQGEDGAYFRNPINPRRGRGGRNFQRPADYREI